MKLIDVLQKLSKGEIKNGTILTIKGETARDFKRYEYVNNCFLDDYHFPINIYDKNDLNKEVTIIEPKPKKYYLRLDKDDSLSYVNKYKNVRFSYTVTNPVDFGFASKIECKDCKTKFAQEEIDENMLLKFIEKYGIKEEVEEVEEY